MKYLILQPAGYGPWTHIDGWSEAIVEYVRALEQMNQSQSRKGCHHILNRHPFPRFAWFPTKPFGK